MLGTSIDTAEVYQWARQELVDVVAVPGESLGFEEGVAKHV